MEAKQKVMLLTIILIVIVLGFYFFTQWVTKTTGFSIGEDEKTALANCLTDKQSVYYVSDRCLNCADQMSVFGSSARFLKVVSCDFDSCSGIDNVPAWRINKTISYGIKSIKELQGLSGC